MSPLCPVSRAAHLKTMALCTALASFRALATVVALAPIGTDTTVCSAGCAGSNRAAPHQTTIPTQNNTSSCFISDQQCSRREPDVAVGVHESLQDQGRGHR